MTKTVRDLGKLIIAKGFKSCPKSNKSPDGHTASDLPTYNTFYSLNFANLKNI